MNDPNDDILIDRVINGEPNLYSQLIERYKSYVFTIALNIIKNKEEAEEAAQDSFIKAYQNLRGFNSQAKFSTWLYRITFNTALNYKRKQKPTEDLELLKHTPYENGRSDTELGDRKKYIQMALDKLPEPDQQVITLFYMKEFSLEEIATITDLNMNTLKVKLHRARKKLADEMKTILKEEALNL